MIFLAAGLELVALFVGWVTCRFSRCIHVPIHAVTIGLMLCGGAMCLESFRRCMNMNVWVPLALKALSKKYGCKPVCCCASCPNPTSNLTLYRLTTVHSTGASEWFALRDQISFMACPKHAPLTSTMSSRGKISSLAEFMVVAQRVAAGHAESDDDDLSLSLSNLNALHGPHELHELHGLHRQHGRTETEAESGMPRNKTRPTCTGAAVASASVAK